MISSQLFKTVVSSVVLFTFLRVFVFWKLYENDTIYYSPEVLRPRRVPAGSGKKVAALEKHPRTFRLSGRIFSSAPSDITGNVTSALLHTFSPEVDRAVSAMFPYKYSKMREINAISPAVTWYKGKIVSVLRIWLNYERLWKNKLTENNTFQDNYLFTQTFNRYMQPTDEGQILGIPVPKQYTVFTGPYDPRVLAVSDLKLLVTFPMPMNIDGTHTLHPYIWDMEKRRMMKVMVRGEPLARLDTNWAPFVVKGRLHYVYSLDPLRILVCDLAECQFVHKDKSVTAFPFEDGKDVLRGGTPFEKYSDHYYLSVAHSSVYNKHGKREYDAHFVLLRTDKWRIVYVSQAIKVNNTILENIPVVRKFAIERSFLYPVGLIIESEDSVVIGLHVNDRTSFLIRVRGLRKIFRRVIENDFKDEGKMPKKVRRIQNYVKESFTNRR